MKSKKEYVVVETDKLIDLPEEMKKDGLRWITLKETHDAIKEGKVPGQWYDTSTVFKDGEVQDGSKEELADLQKFYFEGGRVVCLYDLSSGLFGYRDLDDNGCGVGVKEEETYENK